MDIHSFPVEVKEKVLLADVTVDCIFNEDYLIWIAGKLHHSAYF